MVQTLRRIAKRGLATVTGVANENQAGNPAADELGTFKLLGADIEQLTKDIEAGLLAQDLVATYAGLDKLVHLLEMQVVQTRAKEPADRSFTWHTGVARFSAARTQHALMRIPGFLARLEESHTECLTLPQRLLDVLADFTALTRAHMVTGAAPLTPEDWLQTSPAIASKRNNLGIGYYHLSRVFEAGCYADAAALAARNQTFDENFDVMFYALTYGPLVPSVQTADNHALMQSHLESVEHYLQSPQPAIRDDPERFTIPTSHVAHILSTVDRAQAVLPLLRV